MKQTNFEKLKELAEHDEVYRVWQQSYELYREAFEKYADSQPEDIRNMLWGYAESGRLMYQRMVNIACDNMVFPGE